MSAGVVVAGAAGVGKLALFHHSPDATDATIDRMVEAAQARTNIPVIGAAEGQYHEV